MKITIGLALVLGTSAVLATSACGGGGGAGAGVGEATGAGVAASPTRWPASLRVMGDGYPNRGDPCRYLGETDAVRNYLDHNERLLGCPTEAAARRLGGQIVGEEGGITLVSIRAPGP